MCVDKRTFWEITVDTEIYAWWVWVEWRRIGFIDHLGEYIRVICVRAWYELWAISLWAISRGWWVIRKQSVHFSVREEELANEAADNVHGWLGIPGIV